MIVGILRTGHANIKSLSNTIERMGHEVSNVSTPRNRRITREDALAIVRNIDGDFSTDNRKEFCEYIGITEKYFIRVVDGFVNTDLFKKSDGVWLPKFTRN